MIEPVIVEVQKARGGYIAAEGAWRSLVYPKKAHALNHARVRLRFRGGEIRVFDDAGVLEKVFPNQGNERR